MNADTSTRIAICIDDHGLSAGINEAALSLALKGRLSAISCMVGAPAWADGAHLLKAERAALLARGVDLGLHLDLTGHPLRMAAQPLSALIRRSLARQLDPQALRDEVRCQFDAYEDALGRLPDHIDGHQHIHQLPQVREALLAELRLRLDRPGATRPWLRDTARAAPARLSEAFKPWLIERLGAATLRREARRLGLAQNRRLLGVYDFDITGEPYASRLQGWFAQARDGDLLMCHASTEAAAGASVTDPIRQAREVEWRTLGDPRWQDWLDVAGVTVVPLRQACAQSGRT